jgi:hypothetical protein
VFTSVEWASDRVENGCPPVAASGRLNPRVGHSIYKRRVVGPSES